MSKDTLDSRMYVRVTEDGKQNFIQACVTNGIDQNDMHRELLNAYSDGRIKITPTESTLKTLNHKRELYNVD